MRKIIYNAQTTLNNRIANQDGVFWEPFPWGETEQAFANQLYAGTDTWVMSRKMLLVIHPAVIQPAVIGAGPRLFSDDDLALRLIEATPFPAGAVVMRYGVLR